MHVVIVGGGIAGVTAARTIRKNAPESKISIFSDEKYPYYSRPRLYEILSGKAETSEIYVFSENWYERNGIELHLDKKITDIQTVQKRVTIEDGSIMEYDKLLLANGAHPFIPPIKGIDKTGVFTLRSIKDASIIKEHSRKARKILIVGGGLLGLEFASSLAKLGQKVCVVEIFPRLLPRQLDEDGAEILKGRIERHGIEIILGVKIQEISGKDKVSGILLDNGKKLQGDLILVSAGVRSNIELAVRAEIKTNKGIIVDRYLQTSVKDIYAIGDVAEFEGRVYGIIPAAQDQAKIAAKNILKKESHIYRGTIPSSTLKIVGVDLTSIGLVNPESDKTDEIKRIEQQGNIYRKIVLEKGRIVGAIILGTRNGITPLKRIMDQRIDVTKYRELLLKDEFDFSEISS